MGDGMKIEKKLFIILISLLIIVLLIVFIKNYNLYQKQYEVSRMPLSSLSILNNEVELSDSKRSYSLNIDCSSLKDENTQIVSYQLQRYALEDNISISSVIYDGNKVLTDNYDHLTSLNTTIKISDKNKTYEQVFVINATCE